MTIKRVTIADIAKECGVSRNTVSKIFNNRGTVAESTRQQVLNKAKELGYQVIMDESPSKPPAHPLSIALLTNHLPSSHHFGSYFISAFADHLSRMGYTLTICEVTPDELDKHILPGYLSLNTTAGIVAIELFDKPYHDMLCSLGLPLLFVDNYYGIATETPRCDMIFMENISSTYILCAEAIKHGAKNIGFIGDITHCNSFSERWIGFCMALEDHLIHVNKELCILEPDNSPYTDSDWIYDKLQNMPVTPDAFICANDFLAVHLMAALKQHGISIPGDIMVTGFDDSPQSAIVDPPLSTAAIPSNEIGRLAAETLLRRVDNPNQPYQRIYVATVPTFRASTRSKTDACMMPYNNKMGLSL